MRFLCFIVFAWACAPLYGQESAWSVRNYSAIDGLPQSQVNMLLEDNNGYLWIGTHGGGLARFDGRSFKVYTTLDGMLSNIVTHLKLDARQDLWLVHPRGVSRFDGVRFTNFVQPGAAANAHKVRRLFEVGDTLFMLSSPGHLGKIYNDSVYYWSKPLPDGKLALYSHRMPDGRTLLYANDSSFRLINTANQTPISHKGTFSRLKEVFNLNQQVWITTDKGRFTIDFETGSFVPASLPVQNYILYSDTLNNVFWTRSLNTLIKARVNGEKVYRDTVLRDIDVTQVLVDSEGNTWFATHGRGLFKYYIQDFDRVTPEELNVVMAVHRDRQGVLWVGSMTEGLWSFREGKGRSYYNKANVYRNAVNSIAEAPDGTLWIATSSGLGKFDRARDRFRWYTRQEGLSSAVVLNVAFDATGRLYAGTLGGGVNVFDGTTFTSITTDQGLNSNMVSAIHFSEPYGKLFVGTEYGLNSVQDSRVESIFIPEIANAGITSLQTYRDSLLLIGTGGAGVVVFHPGTRTRKMLTTHQGLPSDFIYLVAPDCNEYIWIGSEKGLTRVRLAADLEIIENLHYGFENGLKGIETNQNAFYLGDSLKLFGLIDGLYRFNSLERTSFRSFDLHLTGIELFYGAYPLRQYADSVSGFFQLPSGLRLPPDANHITFRYNRVDKRYPKAVKFRYLLENFDKTWSPPSSNTEVTYSNLPPGDYVFRVVATDNHGSWSSRAISYPFTIKTPFYKTASFLVGMVILLGGSVTLVMYVRVRSRVRKLMMTERIRQREQEALRKEIARDFHDEMGNQLTRIINYVSLLKLNGSDKVNGTQDLYAKVEDSAKYLYTGTRDFIWSIDPGNDELSKLFLHIRDFGEKLFEEKGISFRAFNEVKERCKLPYGFSREANLIFKEAMTNAFKYSCARNVTLALHRSDEEFEMSFQDDGVGFYPGEVEQSNGLKNIRERADRIRSILRIQSMPQKGTKIVLRFKLNKTLKYGLTV